MSPSSPSLSSTTRSGWWSGNDNDDDDDDDDDGGQAEAAERAQGDGGQPLRPPDDHRGLLPRLQQPQDLPQHARDHCHQGDLWL